MALTKCRERGGQVSGWSGHAPVLRGPQSGNVKRRDTPRSRGETLVYKRTHSGDPSPTTGVFGNRDCMGREREWKFESVVGVGGIGREAYNKDMAAKPPDSGPRPSI
jgi:hypothetical protein